MSQTLQTLFWTLYVFIPKNQKNEGLTFRDEQTILYTCNKLPSGSVYKPLYG